MSNKKTVLVTLADKKFLNQARQLFSSAYWNGGWDGDYLLLAHGDIPEKDLEWFKEKGITIFRCKPLTEKKEIGGGYPSVLLDKIYIFTPYFKRWKTVVYLDADVIVRASLKRMETIKGKIKIPRAHGANLRKEFVERNKENFRLFDKLEKEYSIKGKAFCAGIMAFDTNIITNTTFYELLSLYNKYGSLNRYGDEGTMNLFFLPIQKELPFVYNVFPGLIKFMTGISYKKIRAVALHCVNDQSLSKPWLPTSPFYEEWLLNFKKSDAMDIKNPQIPAKTWTPWEEKRYEWYLMARRILYIIYRFIKNLVSSMTKMVLCFSPLPDRLIGKIGLLIKKIHPRLYERIRIKHE